MADLWDRFKHPVKKSGLISFVCNLFTILQELFFRVTGNYCLPQEVAFSYKELFTVSLNYFPLQK